jgi:cation diffusion facilitator CzcD-associated flavoprotein CzcO
MPDTNVPIRNDYDAVVIGAGFSGLYMLHKLRELGLCARAGGDSAVFELCHRQARPPARH